jgi:hypothetical protein
MPAPLNWVVYLVVIVFAILIGLWLLRQLGIIA